MHIEQVAKMLIILHATFGGVALLSGAISLISKKGNKLHKKSGKIFYYAMLTSILISFVISVLPNHKSTFLFCIGLFSAYFIIGGYRSLKFKKQNVSYFWDKIIAYLIIIIGIAMIIYPVLLEGRINIVLLVFGIVALLFGGSDIFRLKDKKEIKKNWLKIHLSKMIGGYIAAVTAFVVVNQWLPSIWAWFTPSVFGTSYIVFWLNRIKKENHNQQEFLESKKLQK